MIAMRRLMIGSWGVEAGFRVRVIHPATRFEPVQTRRTEAERAHAQGQVARRMDAHRIAAEKRWWEHGGR